MMGGRASSKLPPERFSHQRGHERRKLGLYLPLERQQLVKLPTESIEASNSRSLMGQIWQANWHLADLTTVDILLADGVFALTTKISLAFFRVDHIVHKFRIGNSRVNAEPDEVRCKQVIPFDVKQSCLTNQSRTVRAIDEYVSFFEPVSFHFDWR